MSTSRKIAVVVGALFLIAMVTSLAGGVWLESITSAPDYLTSVSANEAQVIIAVLLELVNCIAVVGIGAMLFPVLRRQNEALALSYAGIRVVEAAILVIATVGPLSLVALSREYVAAGVPDSAYFQTLGVLVMAPRVYLTGLLTVVFFSLGAVLLYSLLYQSRLVPRFIPIWGFIAVAMMFASNMLAVFGMNVSAEMIFVLPIILNEIFLGIWLIAKGFNPSVFASQPAQTEAYGM